MNFDNLLYSVNEMDLRLVRKLVILMITIIS